MKVQITNKIVLQCSSKEWFILEEKIKPYIVVENKAYLHKVNLGFSVQEELKEFALADLKISDTEPMVIELTMPLGLWDFIKHLFKKEDVSYQQTNVQVNPALIHKYNHLYKYQKTAVSNMLPHKNGILVAGTGSGKTMMGLALSLLKGKSILWINDRIELCKQARTTAIKHFNLSENDCGLLQGDNEVIQKYTFTTIQKLNKVLNEGFNDVTKKLIHFDTIIIDECHHCIGSFNDYKQYFQVLNELDYKHVYGLTATPKRVDGNESLVYAILGPVRFEVAEKTKTMKAEIKNVHCHINTSEEIYRSFLNQYTGKAIPARVDEYLLFHNEYLDFIEPYIDKIIKEYNKVLIVSPRVAGAQYISDILNNKNVEHFLVYGAIKKRERMYTEKILVATLDLVKEGFDVPTLEAVIVLARKPHKQIITQIVGRTERYVEGKKQPVAYFLIPNMKRFERKSKVVWEDLDLGKI